MNGDNTLITEPGTYSVAQLSYTMRVEIAPDHLVRYSVSDAGNSNVLQSVERFSHGQRWCLFWDSQDRFWVWSSDIGGFVWQRDESNAYRQSPTSDNEELYKQMPDQVFDYLPNTMKKKWQDRRVR